MVQPASGMGHKNRQGTHSLTVFAFRTTDHAAVFSAPGGGWLALLVVLLILIVLLVLLVVLILVVVLILLVVLVIGHGCSSPFFFQA